MADAWKTQMDVNGTAVNIYDQLVDASFAPTCKDEAMAAIAQLSESSEAVNNRRQGVNNFFLTTNTLLLGGVGWLLSESIPKNETPSAQVTWSVAVIVFLGVLLCSFWLLFLESYKKVSRSKIELTKQLEQQLKIRPFTVQYLLMDANGYLPLTDLESWIARTFLAVHGILLVLSLTYALGLFGFARPADTHTKKVETLIDRRTTSIPEKSGVTHVTVSETKTTSE